MTRSTLGLRPLVLGMLILGACAKTQSSEGTDSTTHFLQSCVRDTECGSLSCLCGVCTRACERDASCADLDDDASCAPTAETCSEPAMACARSASGSGPGGSGAGGSDRDAAAPASDAGPTLSCPRMDARSNGDDCVDLAGFAWNGLSCSPVICGCTGVDCAAIYRDETSCEDAFRDCAPVTMCTGPSDCVLVGGGCCDCDPDVRELGTISKEASAEYWERICEGDVLCDVCPDEPMQSYRRRFLPACVPATRWEGGECTLVDLAQLRCNATDGCRVRTRTCCECNASTAVDHLMAVPNGGDTAWFNATCTPNQACPDCETLYPENIQARCGEGGFCELTMNGAPIVP